MSNSPSSLSRVSPSSLLACLFVPRRSFVVTGRVRRVLISLSSSSSAGAYESVVIVVSCVLALVLLRACSGVSSSLLLLFRRVFNSHPSHPTEANRSTEHVVPAALRGRSQVGVERFGRSEPATSTAQGAFYSHDNTFFALNLRHDRGGKYVLFIGCERCNSRVKAARNLWV